MSNSDKRKFIHWCTRYFGAWADLLAGLVGVCTLGLVYPSWGFEAVVYFSLKQMEIARKEIDDEVQGVSG